MERASSETPLTLFSKFEVASCMRLTILSLPTSILNSWQRDTSLQLHRERRLHSWKSWPWSFALQHLHLNCVIATQKIR